MQSVTQRTSAVDAARKRKRGPTVTERRAELQRAEQLAAVAPPSKRKKEKRAPQKKAPQKQKKAPQQKQSAQKQPTKRKTKQPKKAVTVRFGFHFEKRDYEEDVLHAGEAYIPDQPGREAHLDSPPLTEADWEQAIEASPPEQFTFTLNADKENEALLCSMHLDREKDGNIQLYEEDNDMSSELTWEEVMRLRTGNKRKWSLSWSGFSPGWFEADVTLQRGDKQLKVQILRAGLAVWMGDDEGERWDALLNDEGYSEDEDDY